MDTKSPAGAGAAPSWEPGRSEQSWSIGAQESRAAPCRRPSPSAKVSLSVQAGNPGLSKDGADDFGFRLVGRYLYNIRILHSGESPSCAYVEVRCCRSLAERRQRPRRATASECVKLRRARENPPLERILLHAHARVSDPKPRRNQNAKRDSSKASKRRFSQLRFQIRVCIRACIRPALPWVAPRAQRGSKTARTQGKTHCGGAPPFALLPTSCCFGTGLLWQPDLVCEEPEGGMCLVVVNAGRDEVDGVRVDKRNPRRAVN
jgi:hypothetical protein